MNEGFVQTAAVLGSRWRSREIRERYVDGLITMECTPP